jgi:FemAB-related protein (PEP-CTERM system-associated)
MTDSRCSVRPYTPADGARWDAFVEQATAGTFFHLSGWHEVLARATPARPHYLLAERDGAVVGVLPLARNKSVLFGDHLVSTPFCVYGGVLASDAVAHAALETAAVELAQSLGVQDLELRNIAARRDDWQRRDQYVTFRRELSADVEQNMLAIPRKQRAVVRKGRDAGLESRIDNEVETLYDIYSESVRNLGTPVFSRKYLRTLHDVFRSRVQVLTVTNKGEPITSVLSLLFRDEIHPYYGGGRSVARDLYANDFMYWEVMRRAVENGVKTFDYGRSKRDSGSYRFKKHWGFEETPLNYEVKLIRATEVTNLSPTNPKYELMVKTWKKMPLWASRLVGPFVAGNLG